MYIVKKSHHNPIFSHHKENIFEAYAAFNMSVIQVGKYIYGVYRAESAKDPTRSPERISSIGIARSLDGKNFEDRRLFIEPSEDFDRCGCEDPRITFFEGKYYIFYTALSGYPFNADNIKVAVAISSDLKTIEKKILVTPFNAKAMSLFPERIGGKIHVSLSVNTDRGNMQLAVADFDNIEELFDKNYWDKWYLNLESHSIKNIRRHENDFYEGGAVPIYTKHGWLFIYSYIQNYKPNTGDKIFGIEALILDIKDPKNIIARTDGPLIVPSEDYEILGRIENICFPTGALVKDQDKLYIYYGVVDAKTCVACVDINDLLNTILPRKRDKYKFQRLSDLPIISPADNEFEKLATFNPASIYLDNKVHILYRAMSLDNTSTIGYATSSNGLHIDYRSKEPIYTPRADFEMKRIPGGNSGCEDPRIILIDNYIYMFYTAYNGVDLPKVAVTKISKKDFINNNWNWEEPFIISPDGFDDKDTCVLPEKVNGEYFIIHRIGIDICGDYIPDLDFEFERIDRCISVMGPRANTWDNAKVGIATPPIRTKYGWLLLYHGISKSHNTYRLGAALLDLEDPSYMISRLADPIFEPELNWEKEGVVNNVVFPCGACEIGKYLYIYYGGADKHIGVARIETKLLLDALRR